jgi:hypothetical protein
MTLDYDQLAQQHGFSKDAVMVMAAAVQRGSGTMAQFNHPELGGQGQWMPGMVSIGDMFNNALKARVQLLAEAIASEYRQAGGGFTPMPPMQMSQWWAAANLGTPSQAGEQNDSRYAYFQSKDRLVIERGGQLMIYDTAGYTLTGAMQQQSNTTGTLAFNTPHGTVTEADLKHLATQPT